MKPIVAIAAVLTLGCSVFAQELSIERLAPEDTVFIAGVKNCKDAYERFNRTTLPKIMDIDAVKKAEEEAMEEAPLPDRYERIIEETLKELGIEEEPEQIAPQGPMGLAVYLRTNEDSSREPGVFVFADFADNADRVQTVIDRLLTEADEDENIHYDLEEVMGRKVYSFKRPAVDEEHLDEALDEFEPEMDPMVPMPGVNDFFQGMDEVHFTRDGNVFFAASDIQQLTDAFDLVDKKTGTAFADSDDFQGARALLGEGDGQAMLFFRPLFQLMAEEDPSFAMTQGIVTMLLGDVKALGLDVQFDGSSAMVESSFAAYLPTGKSGLTMLLDRPSPRADVPPFVGPSAVSFSAVNIDLSGLGKLLEQFVVGNPMLEGQFGEMMPEVQKLIHTLTATLGDRVYSSMNLERPVTLQSMGSLVALMCKDGQAFENGVAPLITQWGFQPRDFQGQRIFTMDPEMVAATGMPGGGPGLGIGGGYVFIGQQNSIELALRTTQPGDTPTLAGEPSFRRAVGSLADDDIIAWGYLDTPQVVEAQVAAIRLQREQSIEQMKEWNPEYAEELAAEPDPSRHWTDESYRQLRELVGPMAWQVRSTEHGFVADVYQHRGEAVTSPAE